MSAPPSRPLPTPWSFVPTLYFQQGLPVIVVQQFSVVMYKKLGVGNEQIGLWTSLITWPWILKMLWGPLVDGHGSKRGWIFAMQLGVTLLLALTAACLPGAAFLPMTLASLLAMALFSATHDIALDGYYLLALPPRQQAFFVGIRTSFFRLAMIFCNGALVMLAGYWERLGQTVATSWQRVIWGAAAAYAALGVYGFCVAPRLPNDRPVEGPRTEAEPGALRSFFEQPGAAAIVAFILLFRFGEAMLTKMAGPFLLDTQAAGGLQFATLQVGAILGQVGAVAIVSGGLCGGFAVSKWGLRRCIWPMTILMNLPNLLYVWAALTRPGLLPMYALTAVEQFTYGLGMAPYGVFLMNVSQRSRYAASHFAIATGLMALGAMAAGIVSGFLQQQVGYVWFFVCVCVSTVPGMLLLAWIPLHDAQTVRPGAANTDGAVEYA